MNEFNKRIEILNNMEGNTSDAKEISVIKSKIDGMNLGRKLIVKEIFENIESKCYAGTDWDCDKNGICLNEKQWKEIKEYFTKT